ncbi:MAG: DUF2333 family protein [Deltaproteobacteria bacterium]|nr:DUF2333 family protein [Deltaproteobacteria bacterium]
MEKNSEKKGKKGLLFIILMVLAALVVFTVIVMTANSRKPDRIALGAFDKNVKGTAFIRANQMLVEQMVHNWLPNDLFWPTTLLDNMPNFQMGILEVVRYNARVLRDNLSRMRTTDRLDASAEGAFTALANDPMKWWFPSAESKWKLANKHLLAFYQTLLQGKSHFYPRADNLVQLLNQYTSLMGGVNTRLINAPHDLDEVLHVDDEERKGSPRPERKVDTAIPWYRIDDNFYYAQGVAYALYESFRAIRIDFIEVLKDKNSVKLVDKIIEELWRCNFEPLIVFNGKPGSIFANHSLNLSGIFNDGRQKINSLIVSLKQG